jgi:hypothetical protein
MTTMNGFTDKEITCKDCGTPFLFTARDQAFFEQNGFTEPKRCKPCREVKKQRQENHEPRQRRSR